MKKVIIFASIFIAIILGITAFYINNILNKIQNNNTNIKIEDKTNNNEQNVVKKENNLINIVLFGIDARNLKSPSRSDSIIILSINSETKKIKLISLMRDMFVEIPGKNKNRINAAYAFGGPELAIKTINHNFDLGISKYVTINFYGFEKVIDNIGGVEIDVKKDEIKYINSYMKETQNLFGGEYKEITNEGLQLLNGRQALAYSRIRYVGNADYERTERQRRVLTQIFNKVKSQGTTKKISLINSILPYIETNLSKNEIINLAYLITNLNEYKIEELRIPVDKSFKSERINGMAVLVPDLDVNKNKIHEFIGTVH
ncbi:LCP family protein [Caloramator australicus]|uniref:Cell envelope-related transcriptional attenuator n=1 Tax=Caloramator australicus RC3 TaxID=857293 RepID=G0V450_9CLOT|nr:LCP family protein [Caloramator australicus]CCC57890.1 cell envelope-related transcriptional attenuator [Caloramator australicus RC3]